MSDRPHKDQLEEMPIKVEELLADDGVDESWALALLQSELDSELQSELMQELVEDPVDNLEADSALAYAFELEDQALVYESFKPTRSKRERAERDRAGRERAESTSSKGASLSTYHSASMSETGLKFDAENIWEQEASERETPLDYGITQEQDEITSFDTRGGLSAIQKQQQAFAKGPEKTEAVSSPIVGRLGRLRVSQLMLRVLGKH